MPGVGYLIAGFGYDDNGSTDSWIAELDEEGNVVWDKQFGGPQNESFTYAMPVNDGIIAATSTNGAGGDVSEHGGDADYWLVKFHCVPTFTRSGRAHV